MDNLTQNRSENEPVEWIDRICGRMKDPKPDPSAMSPLTLAYIGDAVYEMVIRTKVISESGAQVNKLHKESTSFVKAHAQAEIVRILPLTEEEEKIFKRGRNAKSYSMAKNATMSDYRNATGFEALIGYLYLNGQTDRMLQLIKTGLERYDKINEIRRI